MTEPVALEALRPWVRDIRDRGWLVWERTLCRWVVVAYLDDRPCMAIPTFTRRGAERRAREIEESDGLGAFGFGSVLIGKTSARILRMADLR